MEWQEGTTTLITAGGKIRDVQWNGALKGCEIIELAMGSESSLNQSKIRSSVDLLGGEVREERLVIKGLSNKMGVRTQCTNSLGFK